MSYLIIKVPQECESNYNKLTQEEKDTLHDFLVDKLKSQLG
jgi:hypothetical protein